MRNPGGRILVVDDEPAMLRMMSAYLGRLGYTVTVSDSTDAAWRQVEAAPSNFDLAVIDATMSGMSLRELAEQLLLANPTLTIIAASGYPVDTSAMEAMAPGRVTFLLKPFTPEALASTVRRMIGPQEI